MLKKESLNTIGKFTENEKEFYIKNIFSIGNKNFIVAGSELLPITSVKQAKTILADINIRMLKNSQEEEVLENVFHLATAYNSLQTHRLERDILSDKKSINIDYEMGEVIEQDYGLKSIKPFNFDTDKYNKFMESYHTFFPYLENLIKVVIFNYVTPQKDNFWAVKMASNGGKSLLISAIERAGLGLEIKDMERFLEKADSTSSYSSKEIGSALCLIEDEFKYFQNSYKDITFNINIAEKHKMAVKCKVGCKLMFFANQSESFSGAVDEQVSNRVNFIDATKSGAITSKEWFNQTGGIQAIEYMAHYIRDTSKKLISDIKTKKIEPFIEYQKISKNFTLKNSTENLDTAMHEVIIEATTDPVNNYLNPYLLRDMSGIFIKAPKKTIKALLESQLTKGKTKHYLSYFENWVERNCDDHRIKPLKINGKTTKGIYVPNNIEVSQLLDLN